MMMRAALVILTLSLLSGCNTIAGVGEDITGAARSVQKGMPGSY